MIATYNTLTSNVVVTAIQQASTEAQIEATRQLIEINSGMVQILQYQLAKGYASRLDVGRAGVAAAQISATLPPLREADGAAARPAGGARRAASRARRRREVRLWRACSLPAGPAGQPALEARGAASGRAPGRSEPARGERQGRHRDRQPAAATSSSPRTPAARRWPSRSFYLRAPASGASARASPRRSSKAARCCTSERAAKAAYVQAAEQYRSTVLTAFQNVADTLAALQTDADALEGGRRGRRDAAQVTLDLAQRQVQGGYASSCRC